MRWETDTLIKEMDARVADRSGQTYRVFLYGKDRPGETWQGRLVFESELDGRRFETPIETTQPDREALLYWATGLKPTYLEGALARALAPPPLTVTGVAPRPIIGEGTDKVGHVDRRAAIERDILAVLSAADARKMLTDQLFRSLPNSSADVTRSLEHLEKYHRYLIRRTEEATTGFF